MNFNYFLCDLNLLLLGDEELLSLNALGICKHFWLSYVTNCSVYRNVSSFAYVSYIGAELTDPGSQRTHFLSCPALKNVFIFHMWCTLGYVPSSACTMKLPLSKLCMWCSCSSVQLQGGWNHSFWWYRSART